MPTERVHLAQLRHNLAFLRSFYAPNTPYPDWAVTVAFYAAVHAVEAWLAQRGLHSHSHRERGIYLRQFLPLRPRHHAIVPFQPPSRGCMLWRFRKGQAFCCGIL